MLSGAYGHRTGKKLALAYVVDGVPGDAADLGVEILGERLSARILARAPYDPENGKLMNGR